MLDRTKQLTTENPAAERPSGDAVARPAGRGVFRRLADYWHYFIGQGSSSLTRRIVFLNVASLFALFIGTWLAAWVGLAVGANWRVAFLIGVAPALLVLWVRARVAEPLDLTAGCCRNSGYARCPP